MKTTIAVEIKQQLLNLYGGAVAYMYDNRTETAWGETESFMGLFHLIVAVSRSGERLFSVEFLPSGAWGEFTSALDAARFASALFAAPVTEAV